MKVSPEVEIACNLALREAERRRHDVMTVEHLLYALLHDEATAAVVRKAGGNVDRIKARLDRLLERDLPKVPDGQPVSPPLPAAFSACCSARRFTCSRAAKSGWKGTTS